MLKEMVKQFLIHMSSRARKVTTHRRCGGGRNNSRFKYEKVTVVRVLLEVCKMINLHKGCGRWWG